MNALPLILTVFVACAVEAVEALTIVLAVGLTREWRSTFQGMGAALIVLAAVVAVVGPALTLVPLAPLRLIVGGLLAVFGLQWLRKAILRASGYKELHDEEGIYARQVAAARAAPRGRRGWVNDWYAFTLSFKGVLLEGLEVVFIAITFGASQNNVGLAALSAAAAVVVVAAAGVAVHAPLARVPENTMKFAVGVMLTAFGTFFAGEGLGVAWWQNDLVLLPLIGLYLAAALLLVVWMRRPRGAGRVGSGAVRVLRTAVEEVWGLIVDNGSLAVLTVALLLGIGLFVAKTGQRGAAAALLVAGVLAAVTLTLDGERRQVPPTAASEPSSATDSLPGEGGLPERASASID